MNNQKITHEIEEENKSLGDAGKVSADF